MSRLRALLATLRIANAPSVVSNVWLGYITSWYLWFGSWIPLDTEMLDFRLLSLLGASGLLLYFAGNLANDWHDQEWDKERRPERALPSGAFRAGSYLIAACLSAFLGILSASAVNRHCAMVAIGIVILVAIYTHFHKRAIWAVIPMGLCRAGLYLLGFLAFDRGLLYGIDTGLHEAIVGRLLVILTMAFGLFSFIAGLSLSARYEGMEDAPPGPRFLSKALLYLPILAMPCWFSFENPLFGLAGMVPYAVWLALCFTKFRKPIPRYVSALLAGIPLVDLAAAIPLALRLAFVPGNGVVNVPLAWGIVIAPLAAFVLGRLLQKVAPAT